MIQGNVHYFTATAIGPRNVTFSLVPAYFGRLCGVLYFPYSVSINKIYFRFCSEKVEQSSF